MRVFVRQHWVSAVSRNKGVLWTSGDRDDRMGAKIKTKKKSLDQNLTTPTRLKPMPNFSSHNNFQRNYAAGILGNYHESSDCLEYPKKFVLRSSLLLEIRSTPRLGFWPRYYVVSCKLNVALVTVIQCSGNSTRGVTRCRYRREITIAVFDE